MEEKSIIKANKIITFALLAVVIILLIMVITIKISNCDVCGFNTKSFLSHYANKCLHQNKSIIGDNSLQLNKSFILRENGE